ncbi:MAG: TonB-dependent receptor plug domain-containing protein [Spirochaetes bacterium]|nr:TonB-dependent receptor plug domain-containing protein [Spirochaetota bacterium]
MKKSILALLAFLVVLGMGLAPVSAQVTEGEVTEEQPAADTIEKPAEEKAADEKAVKEKKKAGVFTMGEVVVRDRALASVEEASTTTEITADQLKARSEKTLDQALETVPGMMVKQGRKGQMNFDMRGFQHNTVALLVDGLPFEEIYDGGGGDISRILVMNASKIVVNRGTSSALYGSRGAFGSINVITKKPDRFYFNGSTEVDHFGGFSVNAAGGGAYKNFYFWLSATAIKNDGYEVSKKLTRQKRFEWLNKFAPWYVYGATSPAYTLQNAILSPVPIQYMIDDKKWDHTEANKYYVAGKAGYEVNKHFEFGVSTSYYEGKQKFNGYELSSYSSYNPDGTWSDPQVNATRNRMVQNRAWTWPKDYRVNVAPYITLEFGDFYMKGIYYFTNQANTLEGWQNAAETTYRSAEPAMHDRGKISIHDETSHGMYIYPSYKIADWNKLNAMVHYRMDVFEKFKKRKAVYASGTPNYETAWFKTNEMSAHYVSVALEDEMKFNTKAGDIKASVGFSYDAQKLSRNFGGRYDINGNQDVLGLLRPLQKPNSTAAIWGTSDSFNPVLALVYQPFKEMLTLRSTFSQKTRFPSLHDYGDTADYIDEYAFNDPTLLPLVMKLNDIKPETSYNANLGFELEFFKKALGLRCDYFYAFYKNKIEGVRDPNAAVGGQTRKINIRGREVHGIESTISSLVAQDLLKIMDIEASLSHVYTRAEDWWGSSRDFKYWFSNAVVKGKKVEDVPAHQLIMQIAFNFMTGTSLRLWSTSSFNQIVYVQQFPTALLGSPSLYTRKVYTTKRLHDPFRLNLRLSQKLFEHFELWVMGRNLTDDYNADPLNPGPGMTWLFGASAEF